MHITLQYETQLKRAIGVTSESIEVEDGATIARIVQTAMADRDDAVRAMLFDGEGELRTSVLVFVNDGQIRDATSHTPSDGETVTLMSPISGG